MIILQLPGDVNSLTYCIYYIFMLTTLIKMAYIKICFLASLLFEIKYLPWVCMQKKKCRAQYSSNQTSEGIYEKE
jgi:hypothetical protein